MRVRFAPSPTGHLHVGSARTALFNWLLARHENGTFILRIEDTDQERNKPEYLEALQNDLRWLGLRWDEGPYFQSKRIPIYRKHLDSLIEKKIAYPCYCTPETLTEKRAQAEREKRPPGYDGTCRDLSAEARSALEKSRRKAVIRFRSPKTGNLVVEDVIRGRVDFSSELFEDFVIFKSDGFPVYNFACVIDDHLMKISHVLRGEEHLSNTPRQLLLYQAFEWTPPIFGHLSIILDENRKKLSKREGATYLGEFREEGFLPEALLNFLALLGWAPGENLEIMPIDELIRRFSVEGIGKSPAVFDAQKLEWMNGMYVKKLSRDELVHLLIPILKTAGASDSILSNPSWIGELAALFQERIKTLRQFVAEAGYFLRDDFEIDPAAASKILTPEVEEWIRALTPELEACSFRKEDLETVVRGFAESHGTKAGSVIHPLRLLLTGRTVSPGIFDVMSLLGKERSLDRLKKNLSCAKRQSKMSSS